MNQKLIIAEIIRRYNSGEKESAKIYFTMSKWLLSENTRKYFNEKFRMNKKIPKLAKEACDIIGGKLYDEKGNLMYENKK